MKFNFGSLPALLIGALYFRMMMALFGPLPGGIAALVILTVSQLLIARYGGWIIWPVINTMLAGLIILIVV